MSAKVYVVRDRTAIGFIENNDIIGFKNYLAEGEYLMLNDQWSLKQNRKHMPFVPVLDRGQSKEHQLNSSLSAALRNMTNLSSN